MTLVMAMIALGYQLHLNVNLNVGISLFMSELHKLVVVTDAGEEKTL